MACIVVLLQRQYYPDAQLHVERLTLFLSSFLRASVAASCRSQAVDGFSAWHVQLGGLLCQPPSDLRRLRLGLLID